MADTIQPTPTPPAPTPGAQTPENTTGPANGHPPPPRTAQSTDNQPLFGAPDAALAMSASTEEYRTHIQTLHKQMRKGESTEYVEARVSLPRSLQGLKTGQVVTKLLALNPTLQAEDWSSVTADVVGANLIIGTVTMSGRKMIDELDELKTEPGRSAKVPAAERPNNLYYVEMLMPIERELHIDFMEAFCRKFTTAKFIQMPGLKAFGTDRRLRLFFNTTTAPREVFTEEDENIPIREITLKCGTAAQVIHKWQKLNQFRPPHLANRWNNHNPTRSYAAAATANNHNINTRAPPPRPSARPGEIAQGPPAHSAHPTSNSHLASQQHNDVDWSSKEPLTTPTNIRIETPTGNTNTGATRDTTDAIMRDTSANTNNTEHPMPDRAEVGSTHNDNIRAPAPTTTTQTNKQDGTARAPPHQPHDQHQAGPHGKGSATQNLVRTDTAAPVQKNSKPNTSHPTPSRSGENLAQWQQVKRARTKQHNATPRTSTSIPRPQAQLSKSGSQNRGQSSTNKFAPLEFEVHPTFEDDDVPPITVKIPSGSRKPRRKYKPSGRVWSKQTAEAASHPQELRHPGQTLQSVSPHQTQVLLRSKDEKARILRERLLYQIALVRAARSNTTAQQILLDKMPDDAFLEQAQARVGECDDPPECTTATPIDIPLRAILDGDETRMRSALCFARMDLITRAALPVIYDIWPEQPTWHGIPLHWLPAQDGDLPCLQDAALAALADCPSLQHVWAHLMKEAPDIDVTIRTAANQWRLHKAAQPIHRVDNATLNTTNQ